MTCKSGLLLALAAVVTAALGCALWALKVGGLAAAASPLDDSALMAELRQPNSNSPEHILQLARSGNEWFPNNENAPERSWFAIRALVDLQRLEEARAAARTMVESYPDSPWTVDVKYHLLTHPAGPP
jgi:hypothetical protein